MKQTIKRGVLLLLAGTLLLSLAACGGTPSEEKIKAALDEGTITVDAAKEKGWVDDDWIKDHYKPVAAGSKIHLFEAFETTHLDGSPASSSLISGSMCLVFFDSAREGAMEQLQIFDRLASTMAEEGVPILGIVMDKDLQAAQARLRGLSFPILVYNEAMQASLAEYESIFTEGLSYVFTKDGGFYSAWIMDVREETILSGVGIYEENN